MIANAVNYLYHLLMGRILGPVEYGVLASLYSVLYLIGIIPISASISIVKFISSAKESEIYSVYKSINIFIMKLAIALSIVLLFLSPPVANFLHIDNYWVVVLLSPILLFSLITLVNQAALQGILKFGGTVIPTLISSLIKLILGIVLVVLGWSVFGAMVGVVIGAVFEYIYSSWYIKKYINKTKLHPLSLKPFFIYSFPVLIQALAFTSLFTVDVILVKHFFSPFEAGIYAALSTLGKIIFFAASPIAATMFPIVSGRKARGEAHQKVFLVSLGLTVIMTVAITGFYWLFPDIAIGVLYGSAYLSAKLSLVWMGIFILFYTLSNLLVSYSLSLGNIKVVVFPMLAAFLQVPLLWVFHGSILQVIQISLVLALLMFLSLVFYLGYNRLIRKYA